MFRRPFVGFDNDPATAVVVNFPTRPESVEAELQPSPDCPPVGPCHLDLHQSVVRRCRCRRRRQEVQLGVDELRDRHAHLEDLVVVHDLVDVVVERDVCLVRVTLIMVLPMSANERSASCPWWDHQGGLCGQDVGSTSWASVDLETCIDLVHGCVGCDCADDFVDRQCNELYQQVV